MNRTKSLVFVGMCLLGTLPGIAENRAGLIIQNSTGAVISRCVEFEEETITVEELLQRSGFRLMTEASSFGTLVYYIHDDGTPPGVFHPEGWFWNFYVHDGSGWVSSPVGVSSAAATHGDLFGFVFGPFEVNQPPAPSFAEVCETISQAGIVVDHGDGTRVIEVVEFFGETKTATQILERSSLDLVMSVSSFGTSVCAINGEGQPADQCFNDPLGRFWGINLLLPDETWVSSPVGIDDIVVGDLDVIGFQFALWGTPQPPVTFTDVFGVRSCFRSWGHYR